MLTHTGKYAYMQREVCLHAQGNMVTCTGKYGYTHREVCLHTQGSMLTWCYTNNYELLIMNYELLVWLHGVTQTIMNY